MLKRFCDRPIEDITKASVSMLCCVALCCVVLCVVAQMQTIS